MLDPVILDSTQLATLKLALMGTLIQGHDGLTAYELAVEEGFIGTIGEWLDSLSGDEVSLATNSTHILWRLGDGAWQNLIALSALSISLQKTETHIQWRVGAGAWTNLVLLEDLRGPQGNIGPTPNIQIGSVISTDDAPSANMTGTAANPLLNMQLQRGVKGDKGNTGDKGLDSWTMIPAVYPDGERRVLRIVDWVGGEGVKPAIGQYVGPSGLVANAWEAVNIRGADGSGAGDMLASNNLSDLADLDDARQNLGVYSFSDTELLLNQKADIGHVHTIAQVTDLTSFARSLLASASAEAFHTTSLLASFAPRMVATYAALTALTAGTGLLDGGIYQTNGRTSSTDGGAGLWRYDAASTATANGGTVLAINGGGAGRFFRLFNGRNIEAAWFGCVVSLSDQSTAINNAIAACGALGGGYVWLPHAADARIGIGSTLNIGDGSTSQVSTYGNVVLCGRGGEISQNFDFDGPRGQTTLVWVGSAGGRMVDIKGPVRGVSLRNVLLDGSANASHGLRLNSAQSGEFHNVSFYRIRERHLEFDVVQIPDAVLDAANWAYAARGTTDNVFIGLDFDGRTGMGSTYAPILIYMDGWDAENADPCRNSFIHTKGIVNLEHNAGLGRAGVGIWMRFADSNGFTDTWFQGLGTSSTPTTASWLYMEGCSVAGANYPVNNSFTGKLQRGQNLKITRDATSASPGGNTILPLGEVDQEKVPAWPVTKGIGGLHSEAVDGDEKINFISEYGLQRIRDSWRQQMLNTSFKRATRGTSFSSPAALAQTLDMYRRDKDGTVSDTISRQDFTPGQTDVAFEPSYFLRYAIASASGASKYRHLQRIEDVTRYSGRWVTYSAWLRVSSGTATINASARQNFGSGGPPSTEVSVSAKTEDQSQTVTTDWQRFRFRLNMPSISGKTLGSNANSSYTEIGLDLPVNTALTLEVAGEQLEYGLADTPWDKMPPQLEEVMIARYLREIADPGTIYGYGPVTGANTARLLVQLEPQMRKAPSLSVSGVAGNYYIRTAAEAGAVASTSTPAIYTSDAQQAAITFTSTGHGLTANTMAQFYHSGAGGLILSAEL